MGCASSATAVPPGMEDKPVTETENNNTASERPSPIAFVVPLNEGNGESLIKTHPPKRFQKLEDQQQSPPVITYQMLQDKLTEAEKRRLRILKERIESAKALMKPKVGSGIPKLNEMTAQPINVGG